MSFFWDLFSKLWYFPTCSNKKLYMDVCVCLMRLGCVWQCCSVNKGYQAICRGLVFYPFSPKISLVILFTDCHSILMMLVWRTLYWINWWFPIFSFLYSLHCLLDIVLILYRDYVLVTHENLRVNQNSMNSFHTDLWSMDVQLVSLWEWESLEWWLQTQCLKNSADHE